jgi:G:T-mismatch repair DNA endonuclease (very short patch repair protein)
MNNEEKIEGKDYVICKLCGKQMKAIHKRVYKYDITNLRNKKIIEINGVFWHCKPELYGDDYYNKIKKMFAKEIRDYDIYKLNIAKEHGYDVLVIWEDDYHNNPKETIVKCVNFIYA